MTQVYLFDTTLRDGTQGEGISLSVEDKIKIAVKLDSLGVHYIEGGWPGSNPKDLEFFRRARQMTWKQAVITAFGSTRRAGILVEEDGNLRAILESGAPAITIFGKTWDFHVTAALRTTLEENLNMIGDSVAFLKSHGREVIFDAEHFFDGYKRNPEYAIAAIRRAQDAGADWIVLCDTNGGTLPQEVYEIVKTVGQEITTPLGIHAHNDGELAVANSLMAVAAGVTQVQGTMNGFGERCGNANLCSIIPNLQIKMGFQCLTEESLRRLTEVSRYVSEMANLSHPNNLPFVGHSAFAHKAGMHVNALLKDAETYEHMDPQLVGNSRRILVSELSGLSNLIYKAKEMGLNTELETAETRAMLEKIKEMEHYGFQFEGAEASLELLLKRAFGEPSELFELDTMRILTEKRGAQESLSEAIVKIKVQGQYEHTVAEGNGPVNAMDNAMRKALEKFYPALKDIHLTDYKVRVLDEKEATAAKVRVLIESRDQENSWSTVGVSENIIEASWQALVDSINYGLLYGAKQHKSPEGEPSGEKE